MNREELIKAAEAAYQRGESAAIIAKVKIEAWEAARDAVMVAQEAADAAEDAAINAKDAWVKADTEHDDAWRDYSRVQRLLKQQGKHQAWGKS
jgi:hypothetical protein